MTNFIRTDQEHTKCAGKDTSICLFVRKEIFVLKNLRMKMNRPVSIVVHVKGIEIFKK